MFLYPKDSEPYNVNIVILSLIWSIRDKAKDKIKLNNTGKINDTHTHNVYTHPDFLFR